MMDDNEVAVRFQAAVQSFWDARRAQKKKQEESGRIDAGTRGAVTGGTQMGALEVLVRDIMVDSGLDPAHIRSRTALELPGYYGPEKKWDLLVVTDDTPRAVVAAIEFKSQVGSLGKNANNRVEEAIGSASDLWAAFEKGLMGTSPRPFLGYFFLLEDSADAHRQRERYAEPYFTVDSEFEGASYSRRYEVLCRRLIRQRLYDSACLVLATDEAPTRISHPNGADDLTFARFVSDVRAAAQRFA